MMNQTFLFLMAEEGATAVEYGLLVGLISIVIITALTSIGQQINGVFQTLQAAF